MTKQAAYELGVLLALSDLGLTKLSDASQNDYVEVGGAEQGTSFPGYPLESLVALLQREARIPPEPTVNVKNDVMGEPENPNSTFSGAATPSFGNDLLGRLGVDVRGPDQSTSV
jgi:hypothetical protein